MANRIKIIWYKDGVKVDNARQAPNLPWVKKMISALKVDPDAPSSIIIHVVHDLGNTGEGASTGSIHMHWNDTK